MASAKREPETIQVSGSSIILDIEGTTSSISFVKDVLFPYVRNNLEHYFNENWRSADFQEYVKALRNQCQQDEENKMEGLIKIPEEGEESVLKSAVIDNVKWQMDNDRKTKSLKDLQGLIMEKGYKTGDLKGHLYEDVERSFKSWVDEDKSIYIYSSGSVHAQKLLFGHSEKGDLLPMIKGHFDTTVGMKGDVNSYKNILKQISSTPSDTVFFTDVPKEARAAKEAGIVAFLVSREGNAALTDEDKAEFQVIASFEDIEFEKNCKKRKITSENVTVENKEVEICSLPVEEKLKPDTPRVANKNDETPIEISTEKTGDIKISDACDDENEAMDVDVSPYEKNCINEIETNENIKDDNKLSNSVVKEVTTHSDFKCKTSIPDSESFNEIIENVDSTNGNEELIVSDSKTSSKESVDIDLKSESMQIENSVKNNDNELVNSGSKVLSEKSTVIESEEKFDEKEKLTDSNTTNLNKEAADITFKNDTEKGECSNKTDENQTINFEMKGLEASVLREGAVNTVCSSNEKIKNSEDVKVPIDEEIKLFENKENKPLSSDSEDNLKSKELNNECQKEQIKATSDDLVMMNLDDKNKSDKKSDTKDNLNLTGQENFKKEIGDKSDIAEESNVKENATKNVVEELKEEKVSEIFNESEQDNSKPETVEMPDDSKSCNTEPKDNTDLKEKNDFIEIERITAPEIVDQKESFCEKVKNDYSDIKLEQCKVILEKCQSPKDMEHDVLANLDSTENETEIHVIKKKYDSQEIVSESQGDKHEDDALSKTSQNGTISNGCNENLNGISSPELKEDNTLKEEAVLEGKKCHSSENTVETVIEA